MIKNLLSFLALACFIAGAVLMVPKLPSPDLTREVAELQDNFEDATQLHSELNIKVRTWQRLLEDTRRQRLKVQNNVTHIQTVLHARQLISKEDLFGPELLRLKILTLRDGTLFYDAIITEINEDWVFLNHREGDEAIPRSSFPAAMFR